MPTGPAEAPVPQAPDLVRARPRVPHVPLRPRDLPRVRGRFGGRVRPEGAGLLAEADRLLQEPAGEEGQVKVFFFLFQEKIELEIICLICTKLVSA